MLFTIIVFLLILSLLIFVHELGHFVMARRVGAKVEEFGFGYPPRIFGIRRGETIYSLNLIPIGGFVKILGEDGEERDNPRSINSKSIWQRTQVFSAGVIMNFILAAALLSAGYAIGLPAIVDDNQNNSLKDPKIQITEVVVDSPAAESGMKVGDEIKKVESKKLKVESIVNVEELQSFVGEHKGEEIILTIKRGQEEINLSVVPRENSPENEGPMGIGLAKTAIVSYPIHQAIYQGVKATINLTILIIVLIKLSISLTFSKEIKIETDTDEIVPDLLLDEGRFAESIKELISNSMKAISKTDRGGGLIKITTKLMEKSGDKEVIVKVEDSGPDFPPNFLVFEPFNSTDPQSTGLGLATVTPQFNP